MERLVKDASKLKKTQKELGVTVDGNSLSFGNIVNAISVVQKNMDIMGTTSKEAEKTIAGSINSMKASWTNLLIGMADDNADFEKLFNTFIDNIFTVAKNLAPRIEIVITTALKKILEGIKNLTGNLPPVFGKVVDKLIYLVENFRNLDGEQKKQILSWAGMAAAIGPVLLVVGKLTSGLGGVFTVLSQVAGNETAIKLFTKLKTGMTTLLNPIKLVKSGFGGLKTAFASVRLFGSKIALLFSSSGGGLGGVMAVLKTGVMSLGTAFGSLMGTLASAIAPVLAIAGVVYVLWQNWDKVVQVFKNFAENIGLTQKLQEIKEKLQPLWEKIKGLKDLLTVVGTVIIGAVQPGIAVLMGAFNGILSAISPLLTALGGIIDILAGIGSFIVGIFTGDMQKAGEAIKQIGSGIADVFGGLWGAVKGFLQGFVDGVIGFFKGLWDTLVGHSIVPDTINSIIGWFKNLLGKPLEFVKNLKDKVVNFFGNLKDGVVNKAKELASNISNKFNEMKNNAVNKFNELKNNVSNKANELKSKASTAFNNMKTNVINRAKEIATNVGNKFNDLKNNASTKFNTIKDKVGTAFNNAKNTVVAKAKEMLNGANEKFNSLKSSASEKFNSIKSTISDKLSQAKSKATDLFGQMKSAASDKLASLKSTVSSKFGEVYNSIQDKMGNAKNKVSEMLGNIKSAFGNFGAYIKLPHFRVSNFSLNPLDWINNGLPRISVDWYAKAMDQGIIMNEPTAFGINAQGQLMAGGEAGSETIVGTNSLLNMIQSSVASQNAELTEKVENILNVLSAYLPQLAERQLVLDTGEVVGALTYQMDSALGDLSEKRGRGR